MIDWSRVESAIAAEKSNQLELIDIEVILRFRDSLYERHTCALILTNSDTPSDYELLKSALRDREPIREADIEALFDPDRITKRVAELIQNGLDEQQARTRACLE